MRPFIAQDGDDLLAHLLGREDASGGAKGKDLPDHLLLVEVVVENRERADAALLVESRFLIVGSEEAERTLDGVVLRRETQGHGAPPRREEGAESLFHIVRHRLFQGANLLDAREVHLDGSLLVNEPDDGAAAVLLGVVFEAARRGLALMARAPRIDVAAEDHAPH